MITSAAAARTLLALAARRRAGLLRRGRIAVPRSIEIRDVLLEVVDVVVGQRGGDARHVAGVIGAPLRLEVGQLLPDVRVLLSGDTRNLVLTGELAEMTHRTEHLVVLLLAKRGLGGVG